MTGFGERLHIDQQAGDQLRDARLSAGDANAVATQLKALADPTRLGLALALRGEHELCVCDLSWIAERKQNLVSHHMKTLRTAGLVTARKDGKMTMYALTDVGRTLVETAAHLAGDRR